MYACGGMCGLSARFVAGVFVASLLALAVTTSAAAAAPQCRAGRATSDRLGSPTAAIAWRAGVIARTPVHSRPPVRRKAARPLRSVLPRDASALLVLAARHDRRGRCWLRVRLPFRPNTSAGWIDARYVLLRATRWRIVVSRAARTITLYRHGRVARRASVVIGTPSTPTPTGLFSIVATWRWNPYDFLGSYLLPLTAHSDVLQEFGGGDGRVGIHGRGGESLLAPLGSASSHGCIRLANSTIESIVRTVGPGRLPGIPVRVL